MEGLEVDFFNPADDILDPFSGLHAREAALVARDPTKVSRSALWLNIRQVFSLPRRMGSTDQVYNGSTRVENPDKYFLGGHVSLS